MATDASYLSPDSIHAPNYPRNRYNSFFVSASELEGEKGIRVAPVANPILR